MHIYVLIFCYNAMCKYMENGTGKTKSLVMLHLHGTSLFIPAQSNHNLSNERSWL